MNREDLEENLITAVNYIDKGQYDRFEQMMQTSLKVSDEEIQDYKNKGFHADFEKSPDEKIKYFLADYVQTLAGMEYLEQNNLIPKDYFTDENRVSDPVLHFASLEQIDFYVAHGTDVNARAIAENATTLDYAVLEKTPEAVEKLLSVGCVTARGKKIGFGIDSEDEEIQPLLRNVAVLLKHDFKPEKGWFAELSRDKNKYLFKKYPDLMAEIMSYDDRTNIQKVKDRIRDKNKQKEQRKENLEQLKSMTHDIKSGMKITRGKDYDYLSEEARRHSHTKANIEDIEDIIYKYKVSHSDEMKNAKDNDIIAYDERKNKVITVKFTKDNGIEK